MKMQWMEWLAYPLVVRHKPPRKLIMNYKRGRHRRYRRIRRRKV